jgi:hypothetical protein
MNITQLHEALDRARGLVKFHGLMLHMPSLSKNALTMPLGPTQRDFKVDLQVDPVTSDDDKYGWWNRKHVCSFIFGYDYGDDYQNEEGGLSKIATRFAKFQWMAGETDLAGYVARDRVVQSMKMLAEMLLGATPETIILDVATTDELKVRKRRELEQYVGSTLHRYIPFASIRGLRKGGKSREVKLGEEAVKFVEKQLVPGEYTYKIHPLRSYRGHSNHRQYHIKVIDSNGLLNVQRVS